MPGNLLRGRTIWFWLACGAAAAALISDVVFIALAAGDESFSAVTFVFVLLAALVQAAYVFTRRPAFLPAVSAACYAVGTGMHLYTGLPVLSDVVNQVTFVGGNAAYAVAFGAIFIACTVVSCITCFAEQNKTPAPSEA